MKKIRNAKPLGYNLDSYGSKMVGNGDFLSVPDQSSAPCLQRFDAMESRVSPRLWLCGKFHAPKGRDNPTGD